MAKRGLNFAICTALFACISLAFALPSLLPSSISVNESISNFYNITVDNSGEDSDITEVTITMPAGFNYTVSSSGSSVGSTTFSASGQILRWNNSASLVENGAIQSFWFNSAANTTNIGLFNFSITVNLNGSNHSYGLPVTVNDTSKPSTTFAFPVSNNSNISSLIVNVSARDNYNISIVRIYVFNSLGALINNSNITTNGRFVTVYLNVTNGSMADGNYTINATASDSHSNQNWTASWRVSLDQTRPSASLTQVDSEEDSIEVVYSCTDSGTGIKNCTLTSSAGDVNGNDIEELECETSYTITLTATDYANNSRTNSSSFSTDECSEDEDDETTSSGGAQTANNNATWTSSFSVSDSEFKEGYTKELAVKHRLRFNVRDEQHSLGVVALTSSKATINVSSKPQQAVFSEGDMKKFDVDEDNFYDILVTLHSIDNNKANITIIAISEEIEITATASTENKQERKLTTTEDTVPNSGTQAEQSNALVNSYKFGIAGIILGALIVLYVIARERKWITKLPVSPKMKRKLTRK